MKTSKITLIRTNQYLINGYAKKSNYKNKKQIQQTAQIQNTTRLQKQKQTKNTSTNIKPQMKPIIETKTVKLSVINLEPVQLDVQLSQKAQHSNSTRRVGVGARDAFSWWGGKQGGSYAEKIREHLRVESDAHTAITYDSKLNQILQTFLLSLSQHPKPPTSSNPQSLQLYFDVVVVLQFLKLDKRKINHIAVLNLQLVQKLTYIVQKGRMVLGGGSAQGFEFGVSEENFGDLGVIELLAEEIKYWKQYLMYAITDIQQEIQRYGPVKPLKVNNQAPNTKSKKHEHMMDQQQEIQQVNSQSSSNNKQPVVISKAPRRREREADKQKEREKEKDKEKERQKQISKQRERVESISSQNQHITKPPSKAARITRSNRNGNNLHQTI